MGEAPPSGDDDAQSGDVDSSDSWLREVARVSEVDGGSQLGADAHLRQLGRFRIVGKLGSGGMGVVYRAVDEQLHREVALKVLPASIATDGERRRRLLREARAAAAVTHPNIATVYEAGEVEGRVYVAMELVEGATLRAGIERGPLEIDDALKIARQLLAALSRAHDRGLVHRDLKPENVMIDVDGNVKVLDFGLAKLTARTASAVTPSSPSVAETALSPTEEGRVIGTPGYMAPEQTRSPAVDARADLFSFGVMLYEMLAGARPFTGATPFDVMVAIARDEPTPLASLRRDVPRPVITAVEGCLQKLPEARYDSAARVLDALTESAASRPGRSTTANPERRSRGASKPWAARATVVALLLAAALTAIGVSRRAAVTPLPVQPPGDAGATTAKLTFSYADPSASPTSSEVARQTFRRAMRAIGDGDQELGRAAFEESIAADPGFASAYVQRCFAWLLGKDSLNTKSRAQCLAALSHEDDLPARDGDFLRALAPTFVDPPAYDEALRRLDAFVTGRPGDAEGWRALGLIATKLNRFTETAAAFDHEAELDPQANLDGRARMFEEWGDTDRARTYLHECITAKPLDVVCRHTLARIEGAHGKCVEMERIGREMTAVAPGHWWGYDTRAIAAIGLGAPPETIQELDALATARFPPAERAGNAIDTTIRLAFATGDISVAVREIASPDRASAVPESWLAYDAYYESRLQAEMGDMAAAGRAAGAFLKRAGALPLVDRLEEDATPALLGYELQAGLISAGEEQRSVQERLAYWRTRLGEAGFAAVGSYFWVWASPMETLTRDDASHALDMIAAVGSFAAPGNAFFGRFDGRYGEILRRAGHVDEAISRLEAATRGCFWERWPPDSYHLGQAYETKGDTQSACRAYSAVLRVWGQAKPRSVTADAARARVTKLACPAP